MYAAFRGLIVISTYRLQLVRLHKHDAELLAKVNGSLEHDRLGL